MAKCKEARSTEKFLQLTLDALQTANLENYE